VVSDAVIAIGGTPTARSGILDASIVRSAAMAARADASASCGDGVVAGCPDEQPTTASKTPGRNWLRRNAINVPWIRSQARGVVARVTSY
jgi:hypothetical protein